MGRRGAATLPSQCLDWGVRVQEMCPRGEFHVSLTSRNSLEQTDGEEGLGGVSEKPDAVHRGQCCGY